MRALPWILLATACSGGSLKGTGVEPETGTTLASDTTTGAPGTGATTTTTTGSTSGTTGSTTGTTTGSPAVALAGFGDLTGDCFVLDDVEWDSADPFLFRNTLDLGTLSFDPTALSAGGLEVYNDGNLGGSSLYSEIFAYEVLYRCELASLLKTEGEIVYQDAGGKKTDLLAEIDTRIVGVSVTRAFHYPPTTPYTVAEAEALLTDKLSYIPLSAANADPSDAWERSILSVIAWDDQYAQAIDDAWSGLDAALKADVILVVTATDGDDDYLY